MAKLGLPGQNTGKKSDKDKPQGKTKKQQYVEQYVNQIADTFNSKSSNYRYKNKSAYQTLVDNGETFTIPRSYISDTIKPTRESAYTKAEPATTIEPTADDYKAAVNNYVSQRAKREQSKQSVTSRNPYSSNYDANWQNKADQVQKDRLTAEKNKQAQEAAAREARLQEQADELSTYSKYFTATNFDEGVEKGKEAYENRADKNYVYHSSNINYLPPIRRYTNGTHTLTTDSVNAMTDDERNIYYYLLGTQGNDAAQEYIDKMQEFLNYRIGTSQAEEDKANGGAGILAFDAGVEQGLTGISNAISGVFKGEASPTSPKQYRYQAWRSNVDGVRGVVNDLAYTAGNMAPSAALSSALGPLGGAIGSAAGTTLMGVSAGGNAYKNALDMGYTQNQALGYGALTGASEALLQRLIGGFAKFGVGITEEAASKAVSSALGKVIKNKTIADLLGRYVANIGSEFTEEYLQDVIEPVFRNWVASENNTIDPLSEDALYSGLLGALNAGLSDGLQTGIDIVNARKGATGVTNAEADVDVTNNPIAPTNTTPAADPIAEAAARASENTTPTTAAEAAQRAAENAVNPAEDAVAPKVENSATPTAETAVTSDAAANFDREAAPAENTPARPTAEKPTTTKPAVQPKAEAPAESKPKAETPANNIGEPIYNISPEAVNSALDNIRKAGALNTPYETVLESVKDMVENNALTTKQVSDAYAQGLAEYNKTAAVEADTSKETAITDVSPFEEAGFKRWQKNGMDRLYISVSKLGMSDAVKNVKGRVSVWLDVLTGEVQATKNTPASVVEAAQNLVDSIRGNTDNAATPTTIDSTDTTVQTKKNLPKFNLNAATRQLRENGSCELPTANGKTLTVRKVTSVGNNGYDAVIIEGTNGPLYGVSGGDIVTATSHVMDSYISELSWKSEDQINEASQEYAEHINAAENCDFVELTKGVRGAQFEPYQYKVPTVDGSQVFITSSKVNSDDNSPYIVSLVDDNGSLYDAIKSEREEAFNELCDYISYYTLNYLVKSETKASIQAESSVEPATETPAKPAKKDVVSRFVNAVMKNWNSNADTKVVDANMRRLTEIFNDIYTKDLTDNETQGLIDESNALFRSTSKLIADGVVDYEPDISDPALKKKIKETPIKLSEMQIAEVKHRYGSVKEYANQLWGKATVSQNKGILLEYLWRDLPFDPDLSVSDLNMPEEFLNHVQALYRKPNEIKYSESDRELFAEGITNDISNFIADPEGTVGKLTARLKSNKPKANTAKNTKPAKEETKPAEKAETKQEEKAPAANNEDKLGGQTHGDTQERSNGGVHEGQNAPTSLRGNGGEVLPGVLQTELPVSGDEGPGTRLPALRETGDGGAQRTDENDATGNSGRRSLGDSERVAVPEKRGEHEVNLEQEVETEIEHTVTEKPKGANFVIGEHLDLPQGEKARYRANVNAIKIVKTLIAENRYATAEEQEALSKYVGWGGLSSVFNSKNEEWSKQYKELQALLTSEEYKSARTSTLNAHYTSTEVIRAMYEGLRHLGFKGGRMLEPSGGVGHFMGAMPADMQNTVKSWTMVELDDITGHIAKYLYPNNDVRIEGFEKSKIPNNYMDVAIGNVPFGNYAITDKTYPNKVTSAIHNYFFAKSLDKVRPGGLVMFITSRYTMDSWENDVRKYLANNADFLGAIRLPDTAFKSNAGTEVVTDIIVLRKRAPNSPYNGEQFINLKYTQIGNSGVSINEYFIEHPEMVLGMPEMTGSMYSRGMLTYKALKGDLSAQIVNAFKNITSGMEYPKRPTAEKINRDAAVVEANGKEGSLVARDNKIYKISNGQLVEHKASPKQTAVIAKVLSIRDMARGLLNMQIQGASEAEIKAARFKLNEAYDAFVKEHGYLNAPGNMRLFSNDVDAPFITSLENYNIEEKTGQKADIFTKNTIASREAIYHADNVAEAVSISVNETGRVDMECIASLTGDSAETVSRKLLDAGLIFKNRDGEYETAEQYLSGNVKAKLRDAEALLPMDKDYQRNIDALKKVIPADISYQDIFVKPGARWIPRETYAEFIANVLCTYTHGASYNDASRRKPNFTLSYSPLNNEYIFKIHDETLKRSVENTNEWGTQGKTFEELFNALLNNRRIVVSFKDADGNYRVDNAATIAAQQKAEDIKEKFQKWVWEDELRRDMLAHLYNESFNNTVTPKYDGTNLTVNGMSAAKPLRPHQKDVVQRIIMSGHSTLIAHKVGAGKTGEMAAAAMKLRQLGIAQKPMFVVPKSVLSQWGQEFLSFFPNAKILIPGENDFTAKKRREFMNKIATGDYDAVIITQENFSSIPVSSDTEGKFISQQISEVEAGIETAVRNGQRQDPTVKHLEKIKKQLEAKLKKLNSLPKDEGNISFEELGVDSLFVDEAHSYKNLFYTTNMSNISGLGDKNGAKRSFDMYMKVRYLQQLNGGRGVVFATATPVMNSMSEMYIMQRYLQGDLLKQRGIDNFDAWANTFGEVVPTMEMSPSGKGYRIKNSFSKFKNLGELQQMFRNFADVLTDVPGLVIPKAIRTTVVSPPSQYQLDYINQLAERADKIRGKSIDPRKDNMLKITSEGRKLSYSQRMIDPSLPYEEDGKIMRCVDNVYDIWERTKKDRMSQLVFCDLATPKGEQQINEQDKQAETAWAPEDAENISIYNDIKKQLTLRGIPEKEIAFIHDADTQAKKDKLFDDVNSGKVRVLIGSTGKMGVGMNAQKRLYALHHLDAPWRPGDIEQREGRILRQGNINKEVEIFTYVTESTFDSRMWNNLERKATFINAIMNGDVATREAEDVGEMALSFAEISSIASGNPLIKEQFEVNIEIKKLTAMKRKHEEAIIKAKQDRATKLGWVMVLEESIPKREKDIVSKQDIRGDKFKATILGNTFTNREEAGNAIISAWEGIKNKKPADRGKGTAIGYIAGFKVSILPETINGNSHIIIIISGEDDYRANLNPKSAMGTVRSIENTINDMEEGLQNAKKYLIQERADIAKLDALIDSPFARQEDLNKAIARNNAITNILNPPEVEVTANDDIDNDVTSEDESYDEVDLFDTSKALGPTEWWESERVGDSKESMRISDIIDKMRHDFGIPIGKGKTSARGQYNVKPHTIATKITNDLPATAHELGHFLDHEYDIVSSLSSELKDELVNNLDPRIQKAYSKDKLANEGLAEFVRRYLQNSYTAEIDFPQFTKHFRDVLPANVLKKVDAFADEINAYYASGATTAQSAIRHATDTPIDYRTTKEKLSAAASKEYQTWIDDLHRLKVFDEQAGSNVYLFARNSKYADNIAYQVVTGDLTNQNGEVVSDGLAKILAPINKKNAIEWNDFGEYLVVKHGPSWLTDSKKPKRVFADDRMNTPEFMMRRAQELEDQYPYFRDVAENLYEFQRTFLEVWGVNTGLVSPEMASEWAKRYPNYVPLNRYLRDKQGGNGVKRGLANQNSTIKRAKGSGADIIHPVDNIITNVVKMVSAGAKNSVMVELHKAYNDTDGLGNLIERVKPDMKVTKYDARGLKEDLVEAFAFSDLDEDSTVQATKIVLHNIDDYLLQFTPEHRAHGNTITILVGGKPVSYKVNDPQLLESLTSMSTSTVPKVVKWYGSISRFMTSSITGLNVVWSIGSNSVRDLASLVTYSKDKNVLHIAKGLIDAYKNSFAKPEKQDPLYKQYLALGGGSESVFAGNKDMTKTIYDKITGNKKRWLNPLNQLEFISNVVERGPRYAAFKMAIDMGMTPQEAIYESHNITVDFRRGGNISRQLNNFIPFFNASVQGIDRLTSWITCQDVPKAQRAKAVASRAGWYVAAYALLGAVQFLINNGDDEDEKYYEQLSNYTKNNFWCIPIHDSEGHTGEFITIPKPRELAFPATLTSNLLELVVNGNKDAFDEFGEYASGSFLPNLADDAVKDIVGFIQGDTTLKDAFGDILGNFGVMGVMAYAMANRDFLGKPIESSSFENSAEREKYTGRTSKLAYLLGQALNQSPIMIDYIGQQMLGGFWKTQKALFPIDSENVDYTLGLSNTYRRDSQYSTDLVNDMYDIRDEALKAYNSDNKDSAAAVAYKEASNMTSFYSRYNSLDGSNDKDTRQIVLDMIDEFIWTKKYGERSEVQKLIDEVCAELDSTDYMCKAVQNYIKDGDGTKHTLTAAQYVEYQGLYNSAYWEYVEPIVRSDSSTQEKGIAIMQAQSKAIKEAQSIILNRMGLSSTDSETLAAEKAAGISSDESLAFQSAIEAVEGKVNKTDVYDILDSMDLTDDERAYLYSTRGYSEGSNIYYTSGDLNEWIISERNDGREDSSIARTITSTYKELYIEYARKNNKSGMKKIEDKLKKLKLYKKDGTAYYTAETFSDWLSD